MNKAHGSPLFFMSLIFLAHFLLSGYTATPPAPPAPGKDGITARMLVAPGALLGPGPSSFNWSPNGASLLYIEQKDGKDALWLYDPLTKNKKVLLSAANSPDDTLDLTSALWSPQGNNVMLSGDKSLWLLNLKTNKLKALAESDRPKTGWIFLPDGTQVSYVQDNDLYVVRISDGQTQRLTTTGSETIFNGGLDWVYNEEIATRAAQPAYAWSPDGKWLVYLQLDDSAIQNHSVTDFRTVPPTISYTRYPNTGTPNPKAALFAISLESMNADSKAVSKPIPLPKDAEYVMPFFTWMPDSQEAIYTIVNREHTLLELKAWNPASGTSRTLLKETAPDWINEDRYPAPIFLGDGQQFLWLSERDGFMHLYLYTRKGDLVRQLTQGEWMIDSNAWNLLTPGRAVHIDPSATWAYFITTQNSTLERQLYRLNISDGKLEQISKDAGFHLFTLSGDGNYLVDQFSNTSTPPITRILKADGSRTEVLAQCAQPALPLPKLSREFITIKAHDGVELYGQLVKPQNFDPSKKYPVVVHWYGGPGLQMVSDRYGTTNIFNIIERDVLYTQKGYLVWRLDNRGSFGRGHAFEAPIAKQLGPAALKDQLAGVAYLRTLPYVDSSRIGTDGKSFGGYLTLYALIHEPDVFRCGVAGSGPTDWRYYDTIYTERYMKTPQQNPEGYAATDLITKASQIKARPLLIHGLADTNVHLQNTVNFIQALMAADKLFDFIPLPNLSHSYRGDGLVTALSASADYFERCFGK